MHALRILLDAGIKPDVMCMRDRIHKYCINPLHIAVFSNNLSMVKLLLRYNANVNNQDNNIQLSPLHMLFSKSPSVYEYVSRKLIDYGEFIKCNNIIYPELTSVLLNQRHNAHLFGFEYTTLYNNNRYAIAKLLLDKGADPNLDSRGESAVTLACYERLNNFKDFEIYQLRLMKLIYKHGYKTKQGNDDIINIMLSIYGKHLMVAEYLFNQGIDINLKEPDQGDTALHNAASECNIELMSWLIEHGARLNIYNNYGKSPLSVAKEKHCNKEVIKLLDNSQ